MLIRAVFSTGNEENRKKRKVKDEK